MRKSVYEHPTGTARTQLGYLLCVCLIASTAAAMDANPSHHLSGKVHTSGAEIYMRDTCFVCHCQLGYGTAGPGFRNNKLLSADQYVIGKILLGGGIMPGFADRLSNEDIASVATFIRTSWGNDFGPVTPGRVAELRKSLAPNQQGSAH